MGSSYCPAMQFFCNQGYAGTFEISFYVGFLCCFNRGRIQRGLEIGRCLRSVLVWVLKQERPRKDPWIRNIS